MSIESPDPSAAVRLLVPAGAGRRLLSRREALVSAATGAAGLWLAGCGGSSGPSGGEGGTPAASLAGKPVEPKMNMAIWADYVDPADVKAFERGNGTKVSISGYSSNDELLAKLAAGGSRYDVIVPTNSALPPLIEQDLVRELDHELLPNLANLEAAFTKTQEDPGNKYSVAKDWGITSFFWRSDVVSESPTSLAEMFDLLPKYKGKNINFVDEPGDVIGCALLALGLDANSEEEGDYEKVLTLLRKVAPAIRSFNSAYIDRGVQGGIDIGLGWNGDVARIRDALAKKDVEVQFLIPERDTLYWFDTWMIASGGRAPVAAHKFIDTMLDPAVAANEMNWMQYPVPVRGIASKIDPAVRKDPLINVSAEIVANYASVTTTPRTKELRNKYYGLFKSA